MSKVTLRARVFFLEHEIERLVNTVEFLLSCEAGRAQHSYPAQTEQELVRARAMFPVKSYGPCLHSWRERGCQSCLEHEMAWALARHHALALDLVVEPGRWPEYQRETT